MDNIHNRIRRLEDGGTGDDRPPTLPEHWYEVDPFDGSLMGPGEDDDPTDSELEQFAIMEWLHDSVPFVGPLEGEPFV